jgi:hypothetical protein
MPDGDIVRTKLRKLYFKPYKQICEGVASIEECSHLTLDALLRDIKIKGNLPLKIAQEMSESLIIAIDTASEMNQVKWGVLSKKFDSIAQKYDGVSEVKELALRAGKVVINQLRYGDEIDIKDPAVTILGQYFMEIYEAEFEGLMPLRDNHYDEAFQPGIQRRLDEMRPSTDAGIKKFAVDAIKANSVAQLSLPRRPKREKIDMDEDLLSDSSCCKKTPDPINIIYALPLFQTKEQAFK